MAKAKQNRVAPFISGLMVGGVAVLALGLASGWMTTSSVRDVQVEGAHIDGQAQVCLARAQADRRGRGDTSDLGGFGAGAGEVRAELARLFTEPTAGSEGPNALVVRACSELLRSSS